MLQKKNLRPKYTSTGRMSGYQVEIYHVGLKESKALSAVDKFALEAKVANQSAIWAQRWEREQAKQFAKDKADLATTTTQEYQALLESCENTLRFTLDVDDTVDWESLKRTDKFVDAADRIENVKYRKDGYPTSIMPLPDPIAPTQPSLDDFPLELSFLDKLLGSAKKKRRSRQEAYDAAGVQYQADLISHDSKLKELEKKTFEQRRFLEELRSSWEQRKNVFDEEVRVKHDEVDQLKLSYAELNDVAVREYCEMVLGNSEYPFSFNREVSLTYQRDGRLLGVDFLLPSFQEIPHRQSVRYVKSRDDFVEKELSSAAANRLYESILFQITIRTLHELFEADSADALELISFNGWVDTISTSTGHSERKCVLSVQASKEDFESINLQGICDQRSFKECFKSLKGVSGAKLSSLSAIRPILEFDTTDRRFTDHYDVAESLHEGVNLAAMDWEDFEHLVREVFGKEFSMNGGEVRVTQASRDGGVDAVAFDPDPIRGGKIVIQAKRYTNSVGVAAVRDLYGTVLNEGATKGILVTTSQYGSDAYSFANGKPLTLLNGSNLLHLLEKHGHRAKIDISEARRLMIDAKTN